MNVHINNMLCQIHWNEVHTEQVNQNYRILSDRFFVAIY